MVVKEKRGRRRYVLFRMSSDLDKRSLVKAINRSYGRDSAPYVIQCQDSMSIVRCSPDDIEELIKVMLSIDENCYSVTTSGTLKTIRDKYPQMRVRSEKK